MTVTQVTPLPDYPPKSEVVETSNPSRVTLNSTSAPRDQRLSLIAGEGAVVPFGYGPDRFGAILPKVTVYQGNLVMLLVWCLGEIQAVADIMLSDGSPLPGGITLTHYTGTTTQGVDATLAAAFPGWANNLVASVRGVTVGLAYTVAVIPPGVTEGVPEIVAELQLKKVYDPREVGHDLEDPGTWEYSDNPALAKADFERSALYGRGRAPDWDSVAAVANACDEPVGGEKRRLIGLLLDQTATVDSWSATLNAYAKCYTVAEGARIKLVADRPRAVSRSITDADILHDTSGAPELKLSKRGLEDAPTVVKVVYTNTSGEQWRDAYAYAKAAGVDAGTVEWRESTVRLPGLQRYSQARREAIERYNALNLTDLDVEAVLVDNALADLAGDVVSITSARGLTAKEVTWLSLEPLEPGRWRAIGSEYQSNVYSDVVEADPAVGDTTLPNPAEPPAVTGLTLDEEVYQAKDGTYASRIRATWDAPDFPFVDHYLVKVSDGPTLVWTGAASSEEYATPSIQEGVTYTVEVCIVSSTGAVGAADTEQIAAQGKQLVPGDVPWLDGYEVGGTVHLSWGEAVDIDIWRYEVRYGAAAVTWDNATPIDIVDALRLRVDEVPAGTWDFLVKAVDSVKQRSANAARRSIVVSVDSSAFLVDTEVLDNPTLSNVKAFSLGRIDSVLRWVTHANDAVNNLFPVGAGEDLDQYTATLDSYHGSVSSQWLSETWDAGLALTGNWRAEVDYWALSGTVTAYLELSDDNSTWDQYPALVAKRTARYARVRLSATTTSTLLVHSPTARIRIDAVPREESQDGTSSASGPVLVQLEGNYTAAKRVIVSALGDTARSGVPDRVLLSPETGLVFENESTGDGVQNSYVYRKIWNTARVIQSDDYLEMDVLVERSARANLQYVAGCNLYFTDATNMQGLGVTCSLGTGVPLQANVGGAGNLLVWTARKFPLSAAAGKTLDVFDLVRQADETGAYKALYRNIRITDGSSTTRVQIWESGEPAIDLLHTQAHNANTRIGPANSFHAYVFDAGGNKIASDFKADFQGV